ncbi:lysozyme family protein [Lentibacillus sediminis]|uniref:lysozyme family protein n=1 Tax=Lentibacillus sediminis TaxID=1940529 RepID=UPI000C1BBB7E|nr:lysozyme family protein [Lentibacillus sediminis]
MKIKRKTKNAWKYAALLAIILAAVLAGISLLANTEWSVPVSVERTGPAISQEVLDYRPLVEKYAEEYGISEYTNVLLGVMMQESSGRGNDPMQSSESHCGERGCIDDPEQSIKQGVYYFSQTLADADGDLKLAIQAYNFGRGFIDYVEEQSGSYTQEAAINFSQEMFASVDNPEEYRCPRDGAEEIGACYGDIYYVDSVMAYKEVLLSD